MTLPTGTAPAEVLRAARDQVAALHDRLWAGVSDDQLVAGVEGFEGLKAHLAAVEAQMLAEIDTRDLARKQLHWARPPTGSPTLLG